jgi:DNA processing protein
MNMRKITVYSNDYPKLLKEIHNAPKELFLRGAGFNADAVYVAIVGTRMPSRYGVKTAYEIARAVTERGGVVVSGLAFGVDAACHKAAVDLKKPTIAVLGSGIQSVTPRTNESLAEKILQTGGTLVSEFPDNIPSLKYRYLLRNRIISGMCGATIVIEAGARSGALITARHAFDQNRDIFALTGDIDRPQGAGCRGLFGKDMARPVYSINRLLTELKLNSFEHITEGLDINSITVLKKLRDIKLKPDRRYENGLTSAELARAVGLDISPLLSALSILEINGLVSKNGFGGWVTTFLDGD